MMLHLVLTLVAATRVAADEFEHALVIDAGSTGSRSFLYSVTRDVNGNRAVSRLKGRKVKPGLSSFADKPAEAAAYLMPLFDHAKTLIDSEKHGTTRVFIKATAGMRLLDPSVQDAIFAAIAASVQATPDFPFDMRSGDLGTITGTAEGYFGLLSVNYLQKRIDASLRPTDDRGLFGALGASAECEPARTYTNIAGGSRCARPPCR